MESDGTFFNFYRHGFVRVAVCIPEVRVADPAFNAEATARLAREAAAGDAVFALFPELGITAYTNEDLFHQEALLAGARRAVEHVLRETASLDLVLAVGAPLAVDGGLFNCGIVMHRGHVLGVTAKSYLPNYREFYEARQFQPACRARSRALCLAGQKGIPFGPDLLFQAENIPHLCLFLEICEDVWAPVPPSGFAALAGATVIGNLSASNVTLGKAECRRSLAAGQSARCVAAYLYSAAGMGESTTDLAWDGHALICENGQVLAESERFRPGPQTLFAEIDLDRLSQDRMRLNTFHENAAAYRERLEAFRRIVFSVEPVRKRLLLSRPVPRFPYIPADPETRDRRCCEACNIQVQGLAQRLKATGIGRVVIGASGGLDSTQALLVAAKTMDLLRLPRTNILAYTMPGFATSDKTLGNARKLMAALGVEANELDIRPSCLQMLQDLGHPFSAGEQRYDIAFENVQAGERTSHLFRLANFRQALVAGTGDLSELALGWCTYGVGDHMSHYNVNASVPKTLIRQLIRWAAKTGQFGGEVGKALLDILDTEISPELVPGLEASGPAQKTEEVIGPYALQDFHLFYLSRYGFSPAKVAYLAYCAWRDKTAGDWPDIPEEKRNAYAIGEIRHWLSLFLLRFFQQSQYKRSCAPNGPKVGSGGSLSPRGDYRAPSDSSAEAWLRCLDEVPERDDGT